MGSADQASISAQGGIGRITETIFDQLYEGDGGADISLAVLKPDVLGEAPAYLPVYVQGILNNNFRKYSGITLIDRQNLEQIIAEQDLAAGGRFSESDFVSIGNLTNARYLLIGTIQQLSGNRYSLTLTVTEAVNGEVRASFIGNGTLAQIERTGALINEATADLLTQLGVNLTEAGKRNLAAGSSAVVQAETGFARGITAQASGDSLEALLNYTQSAVFDPSGLESIARLAQLSSSISGGSISELIVYDFQARDRWLEVFRETTRFFDEHPPFEITFDPNLVQEGESDWKRRAASLGMRVALESNTASFEAMNALLSGLDETKRRKAWGFSDWPLYDLNPREPGTVFFGGRRSLSFKLDVTLFNEAGKAVGRGGLTLNTGEIRFSPENKEILPPECAVDMILFRDVKIDDLTPVLTIVINNVNGIQSSILSDSGYMKIAAGNLEERWQQEATAAQAADQQRRQEAAAVVAKTVERQARTAEQKQQNFSNGPVLGLHAATFTSYNSIYGWKLLGMYPEIGFDTGIFRFTAFGGAALFMPFLHDENNTYEYDDDDDDYNDDYNDKPIFQLSYSIGVNMTIWFNNAWFLGIGGGITMPLHTFFRTSIGVGGKTSYILYYDYILGANAFELGLLFGFSSPRR
jgi:hypothetical protein